MWHETLATNETISYISIRGSEEEIAETKRVLYPRYGIQLGGEIGGVVDGGAVFQIVGAGAGHLAAMHKNHQARR